VSRTVWFLAGAGVGVYALTRARRVVEAFTPEGLADRLAGLSLGLHLFGAEVRAGMTEKENDVRERLGVASHGSPPQLSGRRPALADAPADSSARKSTRNSARNSALNSARNGEGND
jgi:hypothetical protein